MHATGVVRRSLAAAAVAAIASLTLAGGALAQTDTDTDTDGGGATTTSTTRVVTNTSTTSVRSGALPAATGGNLAGPATIAGAGLALAVGARALSRRYA